MAELSPNIRQQRVAENLLDPNVNSKVEALRRAGYPEATALSHGKRVVESVGVRAALAKLTGTKRASARSILDAALPEVLANIRGDADFALKAMVTAANVLKALGDDSVQVEATRVARELALFMRRRSAWRFLRYALEQPHRAETLCERLELHFGFARTVHPSHEKDKDHVSHAKHDDVIDVDVVSSDGDACVSSDGVSSEDVLVLVGSGGMFEFAG